jgi:hypothetical protein
MPYYPTLIITNVCTTYDRHKLERCRKLPQARPAQSAHTCVIPRYAHQLMGCERKRMLWHKIRAYEHLGTSMLYLQLK